MRPAAVLLAVSLVLAASIPVAWTLTRRAPDVGVLPSATVPASAPRTPSGQGAPPPADGDRPPETQAARPARIADMAPAARVTPQRLRIPALAVDAPVVPMGVEPDGLMQLPVDVDEVGWYRYGPVPGGPGSAVLAAHVDSRTQGPGVLFDLRNLEIGAQVTLTDDAGGQKAFEVVARRTYGKAQLPTAELFARDGAPRLVLITCGGNFDPVTRSYSENVVVHAVPVPEALNPG